MLAWLGTAKYKQLPDVPKIFVTLSEFLSFHGTFCPIDMIYLKSNSTSYFFLNQTPDMNPSSLNPNPDVNPVRPH